MSKNYSQNFKTNKSYTIYNKADYNIYFVCGTFYLAKVCRLVVAIRAGRGPLSSRCGTGIGLFGRRKAGPGSAQLGRSRERRLPRRSLAGRPHLWELSPLRSGRRRRWLGKQCSRWPPRSLDGRRAFHRVDTAGAVLR